VRGILGTVVANQLSAPFLDQRFDRSPKIDEAVGGLDQQLIKGFSGIEQRIPLKAGRNGRVRDLVPRLDIAE
jgi:hypothetical protein